jgi:hypothetical protein
MAANEEMLEELYELLTLYFEFSPGGGLVKPFKNGEKMEPQLDRVIFRETILARITDCLMKGGENYGR